MRAIVIHEGGGPEVLELEEVPDPVPGEGQVLVQVEYAAVDHFDITQRRAPEMLGATPPFTPGVEAAGRRLDTGERALVTGVRGTYAERVAAPVEKVHAIPDSLDSARAAGLGVVYQTAWAALQDAELNVGDTLLVQAGSSGTGQAAVDIGRYLGAKVYATASASKHVRLLDLGAEPLAYDDERITELRAAVVFDPVGGKVFERSLRALARGGRLVTPGALDDPVVSLDLWVLTGKRLRVIGTGAGAAPPKVLDQLIELAARGELRGPVIDRVLPLEQAAEAHRLIENRQTFGKVLLQP
ncbi:MAG TPA: zinc-binding dehydrogenase [Gaiellales bacterium]|jgi:NADPH:quinone reductase-like Zn-dependent oxidoreductase|nr:zinc-binding dehydrogenase [Gaiellales bacterium]